MSSHHFVREGQEPALLILEATSYSHAEGLLEWAPLVIVTEAALEEVLLWGIKIDVVIALPQNRQDLTSRLADQAPIKIFSAGDDLIEASLLFISGAGQNALSILAEDFPDMLRGKIEQFAGKIQVTVRTSDHKWSWIQSGQFKKWFQRGSVVDFSMSGPSATIKASRLPDSGYELTEDQWITIENPSSFWISEQL